MAAVSVDAARYARLLAQLGNFEDLQQKRPQITFLIDPFNAETDCLKVPLVTDEAASE
ncbi:Hypothetical protein FKW44_023829 [Caligus rogercresseyi]|uniref:Uncharacterized protein n=1 Tax=Caligus rogercresseyi TaxID=217165 RepID=A0A7T8GQA9_CALRO|nr:Hypothetical protein FKW44_023829 [Caligus rogercresseyi]